MARGEKRKSTLLRLLRSRRAILYLALALGVVFIENEDEVIRNLGYGDECDKITFAIRMFYQRLATFAHVSRSHRVWIVSYSEKKKPEIGDPCSDRAFVAALVRRISEYNPSAIAIDHWYPPGRCEDGQDRERSQELVRVLKSTNSPVIIGSDTDSWEEVRQQDDKSALQELEDKGFTKQDQILNEMDSNLNLPIIRFGLVRLNCDNRRIPLEWWGYPGRKVLLERVPTDHRDLRVPRNSLAYETATLADSKVAKTVKALVDQGIHPFTSFVSEEEFTTLDNGLNLRTLVEEVERANAAVLNETSGESNKSSQDQSRCSMATRDRFSALCGGAIIIGEKYADFDLHDSVLGTVPGYVLHANYVDALLTDNYFRPLPFWAELLLVFAGMLLLAAIFEMAPSIARAFALSIVTVIVVAVICLEIQLNLKIFLGFWLALIPMPALEALFYMRSSLKPQHKRKRHATSST
jgi:hypothetical protein